MTASHILIVALVLLAGFAAFALAFGLAGLAGEADDHAERCADGLAGWTDSDWREAAREAIDPGTQYLSYRDRAELSGERPGWEGRR